MSTRHCDLPAPANPLRPPRVSFSISDILPPCMIWIEFVPCPIRRKGPRPEPPSGCVLGPANPSNRGVLGPENMSPSSSPEEETPSSTEVEEHPSSRPISTTAATAEVCSPLKAKSLQRKSRVAPVSLSATKLRTCSFIQYIVQQFLAKFQLFSNCFLQSSEICFKSVMLPLDS